MSDYLTLGSSPYDEECAQVGSDNYYQQARKECKTFIEQLRRQFGKEPEDTRLAIKSFPHDFGTYREVVIYYDPDSKEAVEYAFKLEGETPAEWDDQSRNDLRPGPRMLGTVGDVLRSNAWWKED